MLASRKGQGFRRRPLSMTSLIDVIFLLLLFFMLSSTFSKFSEIELLGAGAGAVQSEHEGKAPVFLRLEPVGLSLNGRAETLGDLASGLDTMLGTPRADDENQLVLVSLDKAVSSQRLVDLLAVLNGVDRIRVMVLGDR